MSMVVSSIEEHGLPVDEVYPPPIGCRAGYVTSEEEYKQLYLRSLSEPDEFWRQAAVETLRWTRPFHAVRSSGGTRELLDGDVRWFLGGQLNACDNCVDRWAEKYPERAAIIWEGDDPNHTRTVTYRELQSEVCRIANLLKWSGVTKGDRVTIYMPMIPEMAMSMLACARIGAIHSVVFGGFSAPNLRERIVDARSKVLICADIGLRGGKVIPLKSIVDEAINDECGFLEKVLVFRHPQGSTVTAGGGGTGGGVNIIPNRDIDVSEETLLTQRPYCPCVDMDSEDLLFMLYTSGSTGRPKGVAHSTGGYLLYAAMTHKIIFDYHAGDRWACVADCGWITGHTYIVYGPLANGATTFMFESIPTYPNAGRYWDMVQRHRLTHFYTAPTAIRTLIKFGNDFVTKYDRSSLRILGSVGEPINPEAWRWYHQVVGEGRCPIMDTYWQTETGGIVVAPLPCRALKPGSATLPFFGVDVAILDPLTGKELEGENVQGFLAFRRSWPGMMRTVYNDHDRMIQTYLRTFQGYYLTGDGCIRDKDGYLWITGRVDDVIKVSGHRLGSAEIEHALVQHPTVSEAAVVGFPHDVKGEGLFCYVTLKDGFKETAETVASLKAQVRKMIGPVATPDIILITSALPKTRSGKIMRRILRKLAARQHDQLGDTSTLADASILEELTRQVASIFTKNGNV